MMRPDGLIASATEAKTPAGRSPQVLEAAQWLLDTPRDARGGPAVPVLRERFRLSAKDACAAIAAATQILARAGQ